MNRKRRRADSRDWKRIVQRRFLMAYIETDEFTGHITLLCMDAVRSPLWVQANQTALCVVDNGYSWLKHYPPNPHYVVTTMFDNHGQVVQWYIDIAFRHGLDPDSVPWYEDLYLDITVMPSGETALLDADELTEALVSEIITQADYDLAWRTAKQLMADIERKQFPMLSLSEHHRQQLLATQD